MHEAIAFLKKRTEAAKKELDELAAVLQKQSEREQKALESFEYGNDFDAERALPQERVCEALQDALEGVEGAREELLRAVEAFKALR